MHSLILMLLEKARVASFSDLCWHNGIQYPIFRETCCAISLLAHDGEWKRCLKDCFSSRFNPLTEVSAAILAFLESLIPFRI